MSDTATIPATTGPTRVPVDPATVPGWGVDADPGNNPTYPMRHIEDQTRGFTWDRPTQQQPQVEILRSIEYNALPAVVGTSTPPSGVSGMIRRFAFKRSESDWWHWLLLMGADRINVVEGVVADLAQGHVPNIPAEMGIRAEWRHNRSGLFAKAGIVAAVSLGALLLVRRGRQRDAAPTIGNGETIRPGARETRLSDHLHASALGPVATAGGPVVTAGGPTIDLDSDGSRR